MINCYIKKCGFRKRKSLIPFTILVVAVKSILVIKIDVTIILAYLIGELITYINYTRFDST